MKKRRKGDDDSCLITFGGQKDSFYNAKGLHLEGKRTTFEKEKDFATSRGNNCYLAR